MNCGQLVKCDNALAECYYHQGLGTVNHCRHLARLALHELADHEVPAFVRRVPSTDRRWIVFQPHCLGMIAMDGEVMT